MAQPSTLGSEERVYIPFLVTERAVTVYVEASITDGVSEEEVFDSICNEFHQKGVPCAEPCDRGFLNKLPHRVRHLSGSVDKIVELVKHRKI